MAKIRGSRLRLKVDMGDVVKFPPKTMLLHRQNCDDCNGVLEYWLGMTIALMVYALAALILFLEKLSLTITCWRKNNG